MVTAKYHYLHYEKAGYKLFGRSVTGISSPIKEFVVSPIYWDCMDAHKHPKEELNKLIEEHLLCKK